MSHSHSISELLEIPFEFEDTSEHVPILPGDQLPRLEPAEPPLNLSCRKVNSTSMVYRGKSDMKMVRCASLLVKCDWQFHYICQLIVRVDTYRCILSCTFQSGVSFAGAIIAPDDIFES